MSSAAEPNRGLKILVAVLAVSFIAGLILPLVIDDVVAESSGPDAYSRSALGHLAFAELLRELGHDVGLSRSRSAAKTDVGGVLVLAEPKIDASEESSRRFQDIISAARSVVLVLPKRSGSTDTEDTSRISNQRIISLSRVERVLNAAGIDAEPQRPTTRADFSTRTEHFASGRPEIDDIQLLVGGDLEPLLASPDGVLIGLRPGMVPLLVISDPDLISNRGLRLGDNAALAVAAIDLMMTEPGPIVFDESIHGYRISSSIFEELFRFPLIVATLHGIIWLGLLFWARSGRFGSPLPTPPALAPGKGFLVENTAALLRFGGHAGWGTRRYVADTIQEVSEALRVTDSHDEKARVRLDRLAAVRGVSVDLGQLERELEVMERRGRGRARRSAAIARAAHRWRTEMLDGPRETR